MAEEDFTNKRQLVKLKNSAKQKLIAKIKKEAQERIEEEKKRIKKIIKRKLIRRWRISLNISLVGWFAAYAVETVQYIKGNIQKSKLIPSLKWWEVIIWMCETYLIIVVIISITTLLIIMISGVVSVACPTCIVAVFGPEIINMLRDMLGF